MTNVIVLDTGPLGIITNPRMTLTWWRAPPGSAACSPPEPGVVVPEIADYELRRELLRAGKQNGLRRLDTAIQTLDYVPI